MKNYLLLVSLLFSSFSVYAQSYEEEIKAFQQEMNMHFSNEEESPLIPEEVPQFDGLPFFTIDQKYCVNAQFVRTPNTLPFKMKTSTDRLPVYEKYGEAHFQLNEKELVLTIYQNVSLKDKEGFEDYLFVPFMDSTNYTSSYKWGRYIDLKIPEGDTIIIDFNKAYNPYCAYNNRYSCPIPPTENFLPVYIKAGVMHKHHN